MINKIDKIIQELDTAVGMLLVASMSNATVKEAMEKVSNASFELGKIAEELEEV